MTDHVDEEINTTITKALAQYATECNSVWTPAEIHQFGLRKHREGWIAACDAIRRAHEKGCE